MRKFRILLVEDKEDLREQLVLVLSAIRFFEVEGYGNVKAARQRIEELAGQDEQFDAAVLDFRVPADEGVAEEVDETLCRRLRPQTDVWHITAYRGDPKVEAHIQAVHPPDEAIRIISKDIGFTAELVRQLQQAVPGRYIKQRLAKLDESDSRGPEGRPVRWESSAPSITSLLAEVCGDIAHFWRDLHPAHQQELEQWFQVVNKDGAVSVYPR